MSDSDQNHKETSTKRLNVNKLVILSLVFFLAGIMSFIGLRYAMFKDTNVHYHANFALFVNGKRDEFKSFTFYEEETACTSDDKNNPKDRVHMHDQNNGLVHVHATGVTWGHFFANIGYTLGDQVLKTDQGVYVDGQDSNHLTFILNGQQVDNIANRLIKSEDRLLINYGNDDSKTIQKRFDIVPTDAHQANTEQDPASCKGSVKINAWQRLKISAGLRT
jgi:hypothetical protein